MVLIVASPCGLSARALSAPSGCCSVRVMVCAMGCGGIFLNTASDHWSVGVGVKPCCRHLIFIESLCKYGGTQAFTGYSRDLIPLRRPLGFSYWQSVSWTHYWCMIDEDEDYNLLQQWGSTWSRAILLVVILELMGPRGSSWWWVSPHYLQDRLQ